MIQYVNHRYNEWARWCITGRCGGLGYPRQVAFMRLTPATANGYMPIVDEHAWEVEQCVLRLEPQEQHLVREFYLRQAVQIEIIARDLGCHRDTVYARLDRVHKKTLGWLNDLAAGVALPVARQVKKVPRVRRG